MRKSHEELVALRVAKGFNQAESRELLAELIASHEGDNLASALSYQGFTNGKG